MYKVDLEKAEEPEIWCAEFIASKGDDASLFVKIDRNTNITVPTNKGCLASCLTFSSVLTVLPSLV